MALTGERKDKRASKGAGLEILSGKRTYTKRGKGSTSSSRWTGGARGTRDEGGEEEESNNEQETS